MGRLLLLAEAPSVSLFPLCPPLFPCRDTPRLERPEPARPCAVAAATTLQGLPRPSPIRLIYACLRGADAHGEDALTATIPEGEGGGTSDGVGSSASQGP